MSDSKRYPRGWSTASNRIAELEEKLRFYVKSDNAADSRIAELEDFLREYLKVGHTLLAERAKALLEKGKFHAEQ